MYLTNHRKVILDCILIASKFAHPNGAWRQITTLSNKESVTETKVEVKWNFIYMSLSMSWPTSPHTPHCYFYPYNSEKWISLAYINYYNYSECDLVIRWAHGLPGLIHFRRYHVIICLMSMPIYHCSITMRTDMKIIKCEIYLRIGQSAGCHSFVGRFDR